jgi:hypothetical protein
MHSSIIFSHRLQIVVVHSRPLSRAPFRDCTFQSPRVSGVTFQCDFNGHVSANSFVCDLYSVFRRFLCSFTHGAWAEHHHRQFRLSDCLNTQNLLKKEENWLAG